MDMNQFLIDKTSAKSYNLIQCNLTRFRECIQLTCWRVPQCDKYRHQIVVRLCVQVFLNHFYQKIGQWAFLQSEEIDHYRCLYQISLQRYLEGPDFQPKEMGSLV